MPDHNPNDKERGTLKILEEQAARIPSDVYLWAAVGTMVLSATLFCTRYRHASIFFGQWAPSLLIIGLYNKIVITQGHNKEDKPGDKPAVTSKQPVSGFV